MNLFEFLERFPGENDCLNYFIETRQKAGVSCRKCGSNKHVWSAEFDRFECVKCGNRIGVKSGTLMENSKLPVKYWFIAIQLLTSSSDNFSIAELQEKISGAEQNEVLKILEILKAHLDKLENDHSFEQLLLACIVDHNHPPAIDKINQNKN